MLKTNINAIHNGDSQCFTIKTVTDLEEKNKETHTHIDLLLSSRDNTSSEGQFVLTGEGSAFCRLLMTDRNIIFIRETCFNLLTS